ncbi:MAG: hypothetical protein AVDCRST_MAG05-581, partial [uncultured Rubrobacteraceae bacterium]
ELRRPHKGRVQDLLAQQVPLVLRLLRRGRWLELRRQRPLRGRQPRRRPRAVGHPWHRGAGGPGSLRQRGAARRALRRDRPDRAAVPGAYPDLAGSPGRERGRHRPGRGAPVRVGLAGRSRERLARARLLRRVLPHNARAAHRHRGAHRAAGGGNLRRHGGRRRPGDRRGAGGAARSSGADRGLHPPLRRRPVRPEGDRGAPGRHLRVLRRRVQDLPPRHRQEPAPLAHKPAARDRGHHSRRVGTRHRRPRPLSPDHPPGLRGDVHGRRRDGHRGRRDPAAHPPRRLRRHRRVLPLLLDPRLPPPHRAPRRRGAGAGERGGV